MSDKQEKTITQYEQQGWIVVTAPMPERGNAVMMEGPNTHIEVLPDGSIRGTTKQSRCSSVARTAAS